MTAQETQAQPNGMPQPQFRRLGVIVCRHCSQPVTATVRLIDGFSFRMGYGFECKPCGWREPEDLK